LTKKKRIINQRRERNQGTEKEAESRHLVGSQLFYAFLSENGSEKPINPQKTQEKKKKKRREKGVWVRGILQARANLPTNAKENHFKVTVSQRSIHERGKGRIAGRGGKDIKGGTGSHVQDQAEHSQEPLIRARRGKEFPRGKVSGTMNRSWSYRKNNQVQTTLFVKWKERDRRTGGWGGRVERI